MSIEMANFHIGMYPWYAVGLIIPYIHLANELAARGHRISFLLPKNSQLQFQHLNLHQNLVTFHPITVPHVDGLPPGTEMVSDIPLPLNHELAIGMDLTRYQVKRVLISVKPDLVFHDFAYWVPEIANELGIKSVCYHIVSSTAMAYGLVPARCVPSDRPITEEQVLVPPNGYPSSVVVPCTGHEARSWLCLTRPFGEGKISFYQRLTAAMRNCDALAMRTCRELEGKYCDYIESQYGKPVLLTGSALKSLMDKNSEVGIMVKNNHANLKKVLGKPGFMSGYIDRFVHSLQELVNPIN